MIVSERKFKRGDLKPDDPSRVFICYRENGKERWGKPEQLEHYRERAREFAREERVTNYSRVIERERAASRKHREKRIEKTRLWIRANPERYRETSNAWARRNEDKVRGSQKKYRQSNPERERSRCRSYHLRNPEKAYARCAKRRAALWNSLDGGDPKTIMCFYDYAKRVSKCTGIMFEVDHIFPISKGGKHVPSNLQVITMKMNRSKNNRVIDNVHEWRLPL